MLGPQSLSLPPARLPLAAAAALSHTADRNGSSNGGCGGGGGGSSSSSISGGGGGCGIVCRKRGSSGVITYIGRTEHIPRSDWCWLSNRPIANSSASRSPSSAASVSSSSSHSCWTGQQLRQQRQQQWQRKGFGSTRGSSCAIEIFQVSCCCDTRSWKSSASIPCAFSSTFRRRSLPLAIFCATSAFEAAAATSAAAPVTAVEQDRSHIAGDMVGSGAVADVVLGSSSSSSSSSSNSGGKGGSSGRDMDSSGQHTVMLANIRSSLMRQEDSIIFSLIERSQFRRNLPAYTSDPSAGGVTVPGFKGSLLEFVLVETEMLHGKIRRYTSPTERPFFPDAIPPLILAPLDYPKVLHKAADAININPIIWRMYLDDLLPAIAAEGDDFNYGSAVTCDVLCLQALSKRIHFGVFVAEAKFQESPELYRPFILNQDKEGLMNLLTFNNVEAALLRRVELKAATFGQDIQTPSVGSAPSHAATPHVVATGGANAGDGDGAMTSSAGVSHVTNASFKVQPSVVAELYGRWIMPLTKQVQVEYLLRRLD